MRAYEFIIEDVYKSNAPCVPLAIMRVTDMQPNEVQDFCVHNDWSDKRGMTALQYIPMLKQMGFNYKERFDLLFYEKESTDPLFKGQNFMDKFPRTLNMLLKVIPKGKFLVSVRDHAVAIIDGKLYDDARVGRKHRVGGVYEVFE